MPAVPAPPTPPAPPGPGPFRAPAAPAGRPPPTPVQLGSPPTPAVDAPPGRLTLIGTGHVFQVRETIRLAMQALQPDLVFVELDRGRLHALQQRRQGVAPPRGGGFVQRRLQGFQEDVAHLYGADVGEEMLAAVEGGQLVGARIALIDPPADTTVGKVLKQLTWRERLRAVGLMAKGGFDTVFRRGAAPSVEDEIRRYQEDPDKALGELQRQFPTIHRIVIAERDAIMARRIAHMLKGARHGVAVVGDGHVPGLTRLLDDLHPTVYRLADVRAGALPKPPASVATGTTTSVSFGFDATGSFGPRPEPFGQRDPPQS